MFKRLFEWLRKWLGNGRLPKCEAEKKEALARCAQLETALQQCQKEKAGAVELEGEVQELRLNLSALQAEKAALQTALEQAKPEPFPENIIFEPAGRMTQSTVDWAKVVIAKTGFSNLFAAAGVSEIKVVKQVESYVPNLGEGSLASILGDVIYIEEVGYMPGWDLPGSLVHEAVHVWQVKNGLAGNVSGREIAAFMGQQIFEWRYSQLYGVTARNLFKERAGAIGLL